MKKKDFVILVDMDDVLECLVEAWVARLNEKYSRNVKPEDVVEWNICTYFPGLTKEQVHSPLFEDDFWKSVKPKDGAIENVSKLHSEGFPIYVVTSSHYSTVANKFRDALLPYFPFIDYNHIIVCNAKQLIRGNVLIDDGIHNLLDSDIKATYSKILFTANHNKFFDCTGTDIYRANNWNEAYYIVERLYELYELEKESAKKEQACSFVQ